MFPSHTFSPAEAGVQFFIWHHEVFRRVVASQDLYGFHRIPGNVHYPVNTSNPPVVMPVVRIYPRYRPMHIRRSFVPRPLREMGSHGHCPYGASLLHIPQPIFRSEYSENPRTRSERLIRNDGGFFQEMPLVRRFLPRGHPGNPETEGAYCTYLFTSTSFLT